MSKDSWVCIKKLPPKFKNVLAFSEKGSMRITCVDASGKMDRYELDDDDEWTHWQPLPSPPTK